MVSLGLGRREGTGFSQLGNRTQL